ncbi:MAG: SsrA-binding protein SmpB [Puniceicoccales bacterium]|jgi:SsrA-binding protein|nr:SsrA-binding protein SmpB [Puniceicoccales bacterium]
MAAGEMKVREVSNRKAYHRYEVMQRFEAGIVLQGTEVKSFRDGLAQIEDAFVRIDRNGVPVLLNAHIDEYHHGTDANHLPKQPRRLLLHRKEIEKLRGRQEIGGMAIIPLRMYLKKGMVKVEIALCKGKSLHDKRRALRERVENREAQRELARRPISHNR